MAASRKTRPVTPRNGDPRFGKDSLRKRAAATKASANRVLRQEPAAPHDLLIEVGRHFDAAIVRLVAAEEANREPQARLWAFLDEAAARNGGRYTSADYDAAWALPGVTEAHGQVAKIRDELRPLHAAINALPARSIEGLALKARALIAAVWPCGDYQAGRHLGAEEDWDKEHIRSLVNACLSLAGVGHFGEPRS